MKKPGENGGGDGETLFTYEEKADYVAELMRREQPTIKDFRRAPGYSNGTLRKDEADLDKINDRLAGRDFERSENVADDRFGRDAEAIITYALSDRILPTRERSYAFLASDYDDKKNQTDVVFCLNDADDKEKFSTFALQVATTTSAQKTHEKFQRSADGKGSPAMTKYIKYCKFGNKKWREPEAPHFIVGMSPAGLTGAIGRFNIVRGKTIDRDPDPATDFIILSEMFEQVRMQLAILSRDKSPDPKTKDRIVKLQKLQPALGTGISKVLGIDNGLPDEEQTKLLLKKYPVAMENMKSRDAVYNNIVTEANDRRVFSLRGSKFKK